MPFDKTLAISFLFSGVFHIILILLCPGFWYFNAKPQMDWIEIDLLPIPDIENATTKPLPRADSESSQPAGNSDSVEDHAGDSNILPAPPIWLPPQLDSFDIDQVIPSEVTLPGSILPDHSGIGTLPGSILKDTAASDGSGPAIGSPPTFTWQPQKAPVQSDDLDTGTNVFRIEGPAAKRKVIYLPPQPQPVTQVFGTIRLKFWVHPDGTVGKIVPILKADPQLEKIAIEFLEKWRFESIPESSGNQWGVLPVRFKLQ